MKVFLLTIAVMSISAFSFSAENEHPDFPSYEISTSVKYPTLSASVKGKYLTYKIDSVKADNSLIQNEAAFEFTFYNISKSEEMRTIIYSVNGAQSTTTMNSKDQIRSKELPGKYAFQFFYTEWHSEIYTDSIPAISNHTTYVSVYFQDMNTKIMVEKPVIYLYPEKLMLVDVKVKPKGSLTFSYPEYNGGWTVQADPSGELTINEKKYNYLFWESSQTMNMEMVDLEKGFLVEASNILAFLEDQLTAIGFNSKEKADFITFWGPQLQKNEMNFIHFVVNEKCDQFAELKITPKPDQVYRIYILTMPVEKNEAFSIEKQVLPNINRDGFTAIEWGGSQIQSIHSPIISN